MHVRLCINSSWTKEPSTYVALSQGPVVTVSVSVQSASLPFEEAMLGCIACDELELQHDDKGTGYVTSENAVTHQHKYEHAHLCTYVYIYIYIYIYIYMCMHMYTHTRLHM